MYFDTDITHIIDSKEIIRGYALEELIQERSFTEVIGLLFLNHIPNTKETDMLNALFISVVDHGAGTTSALVARISASAKNSIHTSLAAGILGFGERHGLATGAACTFFQEQIKKQQTDKSYSVADEIKKCRRQKVRIPGYGHTILQGQDSRAQTLFRIAKKTDIFGKHCKLALKIMEVLNILSSKKLLINVDGAIGAILADMGLERDTANAFFILGRVPGLLAQILEERKNDVGIRRLKE